MAVPAVRRQARFIYDESVYGEWTDIDENRSMFPNPAYRVIAIEFRSVGPDNNTVSTGRQPRKTGGTFRRATVRNGDG